MLFRQVLINVIYFADLAYPGNLALFISRHFKLLTMSGLVIEEPL